MLLVLEYKTYLLKGDKELKIIDTLLGLNKNQMLKVTQVEDNEEYAFTLNHYSYIRKLGGTYYNCREDGVPYSEVSLSDLILINDDEDCEYRAIRIPEDYSLSEALEQSLKEVQLMREGKMEKRSVRDFMDQMRKENEDEIK